MLFGLAVRLTLAVPDVVGGLADLLFVRLLELLPVSWTVSGMI